MASKFFESFKKFPQQIPIFKKAGDKLQTGSFANYNIKFGKLDDVTACDSDSICNLIAIGNEFGEIKIFGFPNIANTLYFNSKSIKILKFLKGEGRLLSVNSSNEFVIWEFNKTTHKWDVSESKTIQIEGHTNDLRVDISQVLDEKSPDDDTLHMMLIHFGNLVCRQSLIIGGKIHLYDEDIFNKNNIIESCSIDKEYDIGDLVSLEFSKENKHRFCLSFKNGLIMINDLDISKPTPEPVATTASVSDEKKEEPAPTTEEKKENDKAEEEKQTEEKKEEVEATTTNENKEEETEKKDEKDETKEKAVEDIEKEEKKDEKEEKKEEEKAARKESAPTTVAPTVDLNQLAYLKVKKPKFVSCFQVTKLLSSCWMSNGDLGVVNGEIGAICRYALNEDDGKYVTESTNDIKLSDNVVDTISQLKSNTIDDSTYFTFSMKHEDSNRLIIVQNNEIVKTMDFDSSVLHYNFLNEQVIKATKEAATKEDDVNDETIDDTTAAATDSEESDKLQTMPANVLNVVCEKEMLLFDLSNAGQLTEIKCPHFLIEDFEEITAISDIVKVSSSIIPSNYSSNREHVTLIKTPIEVVEEHHDEEHVKEVMMDIFITGHIDGTMRIWKIEGSSILSLIYLFDSKELMEDISDDKKGLLKITSLQLNLNKEDHEEVGKLIVVVGNETGHVFILNFYSTNESDDQGELIELDCAINNLSEKDGVTWNDSESLNIKSNSRGNYINLTHIIKVQPSLPITTSMYQHGWKLLGIGCLYGFAIVDLIYNSVPYTYSTLKRIAKSTNEAPLTMSQQLRKSMRQSFRKLKKFKPTPKHTYVVNGDKKGKEEESKKTEQEAAGTAEEDKKTEEPETGEEKKEEKKDEETKEEKPTENAEEVKTEDKTEEKTDKAAEEAEVKEITEEVANASGPVEPELIGVEISRSDKTGSLVGAMLLISTCVKSANMKCPTLFVGTNDGTILVFELTFKDKSTIEEVKLSKELHLQHKAPIISLRVITASATPVLDVKHQIAGFNRIQETNGVEVVEAVESQGESIEEVEEKESAPVGPSGDDKPETEVDTTEAAKEKSGTMPAVKIEEGATKETSSRKSVDGTATGEKVGTESSKPTTASTLMSNLKKSGTLPASFLHAIGSGGSSDQHELLVVSEEQVKLFNLPSLKAKSKHKVVDTGHHFSHLKANTNTSTTPAPPASSSTDNTGATEDAGTDKEAKKPETSPPVATTKTVAPIRKIASIGLCYSPIKTDKWCAIVSLTDGKLISLSLHNLKKHYSNYFDVSNKASSNNNSNLISRVSSGELRLINSHHTNHAQFHVTDITGVAGKHTYEPTINLIVPDWSRPVVKQPPEPVVAASTDKAAAAVSIDATAADTTEENKGALNGDGQEKMNGHMSDELTEEDKDKVGSETAVIQGTGTTTHQGDVTMDSIKEYITNMDGNVTVKTFESSTEKHITVDDGKIETTIHEKQVDDGQVVKDDVVKITSDTVGNNESVQVK